MMQIKTCYLGDCVEITIEDCGNKLECYLFEGWEARNLAEHLKSVADELSLMFNTGEE